MTKLQRKAMVLALSAGIMIGGAFTGNLLFRGQQVYAAEEGMESVSNPFKSLSISEVGDDGIHSISLNKRTVMATDSGLVLKAKAVAVEEDDSTAIFSQGIVYQWNDFTGDESSDLRIQVDGNNPDQAWVVFGENLTLSEKSYLVQVVAEGTSDYDVPYRSEAVIEIEQRPAVVKRAEIIWPDSLRTTITNRNSALELKAKLTDALGRELETETSNLNWSIDNTRDFYIGIDENGNYMLELTSVGREKKEELFTTIRLSVNGVQSERKEIVCAAIDASGDQTTPDQGGDTGDQDSGKEGTTVATDANALLTITSSGNMPTATFSGVADDSVSMLTIPEKASINGTTYTITEIGKKALARNKNIRMLTIRARVCAIGNKAFKKMKKLSILEIYPDNLEVIGRKAFKKLPKGTEVVIYTKNTNLYNAVVQMIKDAGGNNLKFTRKNP